MPRPDAAGNKCPSRRWAQLQRRAGELVPWAPPLESGIESSSYSANNLAKSITQVRISPKNVFRAIQTRVNGLCAVVPGAAKRFLSSHFLQRAQFVRPLRLQLEQVARIRRRRQLIVTASHLSDRMGRGPSPWSPVQIPTKRRPFLPPPPPPAQDERDKKWPVHETANQFRFGICTILYCRPIVFCR